MRERDLNNTVTPNPKLAIDYCGIKMKNPIIAASGTFGNGPEYAGYLDLSNEVGAISVKGLTPKGRHGNPGTRIAETPSGVLNCIGLENPGAEHFVKEILPDIKKYDVPLLANMSAGTIDEFTWMAETLSVDGIAGLEVNVSCPNVECEGMAFGVDPKVVESVTKAVRKPVLGNTYGGLSGPAVKPVALRMVHQVYKGVTIPIIGLGGIMTGTDAIEFMMAGAQAVQVGTATMVDPTAISRITREMSEYVEQYNLNSITDIVGAVHQA